MVDPATAAPLLASLIRVGAPLFVLGLLFGIWRRGRRQAAAPWPGELWLLGGLTIIGTVLFLAFMTVRYNWDLVDWSYLDEPRYFRPLWPLAALLGLTAVEQITNRRMRVAAVVAVLLGSAFLVQAQARNEWRALTHPDEFWELMEKVRTLTRQEGPQIVFDIDVSEHLVAAEPNLLAFNYPAPPQAAQLKTGRPTDLWLVRRTQKTAYVLDPDFDSRRFFALADRSHACRVWNSSGGNYELHHARLAP